VSKGIPSLTARGLRRILEAKRQQWVRWLAAAVHKATSAGEMVRVVFWVCQNSNPERHVIKELQDIVATFKGLVAA